MFSNKLIKLTVGLAGTGSITTLLYQENAINSKGTLVSKLFKRTLVKAASVEEPPLKKSVWDFNWDHRNPKSTKDNGVEEDKVSKPTATRHIILIRHGQYHMESNDDAERRLTPLGCKQAKLTGIRLKELGLNYTNIVESTMTRAKETSAIIQEYISNVPVKSTDLLREGAPIKPEPMHPSWQPSEKSFFTEGARIEAAFRKFIHRANVDQKEDSVDVVVCHANVIRYIVCRALQFPPEGWLRMNLRHGSITWITIRPNGKVSVRCIGEAGHMPPENLTFQ